MKFVGKVKIIEKEVLNDEVFTITVEKPSNMDQVKPGQFFNIQANEVGYPYLRRPISVSGIKDNSIEFTIKILGNGTKEISKLEKGMNIDMMGPLGNGYEFDSSIKNILIVGGGIGIAPVKGLIQSFSDSSYMKEKNAKREDLNIDSIIGFRDDVYMKEEFIKYSDSVITVSENKEADFKGFVTNPMNELIEKNDYDMVYLCGPGVMIENIAKILNEKEVKVQLLMEEKMACGVGACLVCTCKTKSDDGFKHSRMCKDGPMFYGSEVIFDECK